MKLGSIGRLLAAAALGALTAGQASAQPQAPAATAPVAPNYAAIDAYIEQAIKDWRVPGLAIAIIKGDEIVHLKGYGYRDVEKKLPVTPDTLFVGASTTKAFASASAAILVDRGELDWEEPVQTYLPAFAIGDPVASDMIGLRDMFSHRTGLPRHDLLWYNNDGLTRADVLGKLPHLNSSAPLRAKWQYNNLMYMTAGHVVEKTAGKSWEDFTRAEILKPLGMTRTNFSVAAMQKDANHAKAYKENDAHQVVNIPIRGVDLIGPAGSINSSARDYAQWVRLHLSGGKRDGRQIISKAQLEAMHAPLIPVGGKPEFKEFTPSFYGMGWFVDSYRGLPRVQHGGNLDGFTARVTMFPEQGLGTVIFVNKEASPLPGYLSLDINDRLMGMAPADWSRKMLARRDIAERVGDEAKTKKSTLKAPNTRPAHPLDAYAGTYEHAGYGPLLVERQGEALRATYNRMPMRLDHWHYEVFNSDPVNEEDDGLEDMKVAFNTDLRGRVASLQVEAESQVAPIVFEKRADAKLSDPKYLARYLGQYKYLDRVVDVTLSGDQLMLTIPGQPAYRLAPEVDGNFALADQRSIGVRFVEANGGISGMQLLQPNGVFDLPRLPSSTADAPAAVPADLRRYVGSYDVNGQTATLSSVGGVLTLTVPGQPPYALVATGPSTFRFRDVTGYALEFRQEGPAIRGFSLKQPNGTYEAVRQR